MPSGKHSVSVDSDRWLSKPFAHLVAEQAESNPVIDVLIIGSGYGGAVAAATFAGCVDQDNNEQRVVMLERGKEYLPGSFPVSTTQGVSHLRGSAFGRTLDGMGLHDVRLNADAVVVQASGLGGGSLINAAVMEIPDRKVFQSGWPETLKGRDQLDPYFQRCHELLGSKNKGSPNTVQGSRIESQNPALKRQALKRIAQVSGEARDAALTIAMEEKQTSAGVPLEACKQCGDCFVGCNFSAKESLDTNLLVTAQRNGAEIYTGATVMYLKPNEVGGYNVVTRYTDSLLNQRHGEKIILQAKRVILAAGALGSTEILLRSKQAGAGFGHLNKLGKGFSTNGDNVVTAYATNTVGNAMAEEFSEPSERYVGPTISAIADTTFNGRPGVIEDMAVASTLRAGVSEILLNVNAVHELGKRDKNKHSYGRPKQDGIAVDASVEERTIPFAAMGDDGAAGILSLDEDALNDAVDGQIKIQWPELKRHPLYQAQFEEIQSRLSQAGISGRVLASPLWKPLPDNMAAIAGNAKGPVITTHPLGGCAMSDDGRSGVVNQYGQVFSNDTSDVYEGLVVLDGAIVPGALCTNPALTIAALSLRSAEYLRDSWGFSRTERTASGEIARPVLMDCEREFKRRREIPNTEIDITERLVGKMALRKPEGGREAFIAELTIRYSTKRLSEIYSANSHGQLSGANLEIPDGSAELRFYHTAVWEYLTSDTLCQDQREALSKQLAEIRLTLSGSLEVLRHGNSTARERLRRGSGAWFFNRGGRDIWQGIFSRKVKGHGPQQSLLDMLKDAIRLASHSGGLRLFEYKLAIDEVMVSGGYEWQIGQQVTGEKHLGYRRPSNPLRQLMELHISRLPNWDQRPAMLRLDLRHLSDQPAPLMRLRRHADLGKAQVESMRLLTLLLRAQLPSFVLHGRKPEVPRSRKPNRLPQAIEGLAKPEIVEIEVDRLGDVPVFARLSRYRNTGGSGQPVVTIHGYSASGTTFVHPTLKTSAVSELTAAGFDVWVLDMRSSAGMPTATHPWAFEHMAFHDIPKAVDEVLTRTGFEQLDIFAHCIGAAMFSMAVLSSSSGLEAILSDRIGGIADHFPEARRALPSRIRRAVFSQVSPPVVLGQQALIRSYVSSFFTALMSNRTWTMQPPNGPNVFDRFLGSLPYSDEAFLLANPVAPWAKRQYLATRQRLDFIYAETFKLQNMSKESLACLDDFFGPLSVETGSQILHFAKYMTITNRAGENCFVSVQSMRQHWRFPTLHVHGEDNQLMSPSTVPRTWDLMKAADRYFESEVYPGFGHQDCLIGKNNQPILARISEFLSKDIRWEHSQSVGKNAPAEIDDVELPLVAKGPWAGPMIHPRSNHADSVRKISMGAAPDLGRPLLVAAVPVQLTSNGDWCRSTLLTDQGIQLWALNPSHSAEWFTVELCTVEPQPYLMMLVYPQTKSMLVRTIDFGRDYECLGEDLELPEPYCSLRELPEALDEFGRYLESSWNATDQNEPSIVLDSVDVLQHWPNLKQVADSYLERSTISNIGAAICYPLGEVHKSRRQGEEASFLFGSCQYPDGVLDHYPAYDSWRRAGAKMQARAWEPEALLLLGDQIYADATAGVMDPVNMDERYDSRYLRWQRQQPVRQVMRQLPALTLPDDHEFNENWEPLLHGGDDETYRYAKYGRQAFLKYQRGLYEEQAKVSFSFDYRLSNGVPIFMLDTRTARAPRNITNLNKARIICDEDWEKLKAWMLDAQRREPKQPKIIASPSILFPRTREAVAAKLANNEVEEGNLSALPVDSWLGYPSSWTDLLHFIADNDIENVVLLSGDEHLGMSCEVEISGASKSLRLISLHSPGLYTPYDFANALPNKFIAQETFSLRRGEQVLNVSTKTDFVFGQGFCHVSCQPTESGWQLSCEFDVDQNNPATLFEWQLS